MSALPIVLMTEEEVAALGREQDAGSSGFGCLKTDRGLLPLAAMDVDARVAGVVAAIDVAQTFVNTTGAAIEATYIFPLPDRAAVHRFRMEVAGRVIDGVVDERAAAREQYEEAIAKGHRAAITEEERAGVFTLRVGNLMPGEAATVRLSLVGPLPVDDGEVTLRFPLVVAPRYMPGAGLGGDQAGLGTADDTDLVPDASRISPPVLLPGCKNPVRLGIRVALEDASISDVASSLHAVSSRNNDARVIEIQPGEKLDRDFILRWRVGGRELASSLVCVDDADARAGTWMLTFVPPSTTAMAQKPRDVVFVLDRSGSMEGWKMVAARRACARMIDTLTSRDRFAVIAFDDRIDAIPGPGLASASDRTRFRAVEAIAKIDARGGTELAQPLAMATSLLAGYDDRERVIVLVTDGQVGNEDHILREVAPALKNTRMFTLGIDQAVNAAFLRRLAGAGGGLCELVESEDRLDAVMAKVHRRIGVPVATELDLTANGLDLAKATITPKKLPDVYAGAPVVIFGRYGGSAPSDASITVAGTSFGDPLKLTIARDPITRGPTSWLAASWARAHIRDLEDRYAAGERALEAQIVKVSKQFSVLSRFTAFLAIDRSEVANAGGKLTQVVQPVETPAGWEMQTRSRGPVTAAPMVAQAMAAMPLGAAPPPALSGMYSKTLAASPPFHADFDDEAPADIAEEVAEALRSVPPPPAAPRQTYRAKMPAPKPAKDLGEANKREAAPAVDAYLVQLGQLARELEAHAKGPNTGAIRLLRQRLTEWVEDLRSVGTHGDLAAAVEQLVARLTAALGGTDLATEAAEIARELAQLAGGAPPPKKSRLAFWK
jgi:Ca-activated chloride channel family protein